MASRLWQDSDCDRIGEVISAVQLPLDGDDTKARFRAAPLALSPNQSILVVDDEESVRVSMRRFLEKVGFEVREAWSGRSALAQITGGRPPDLVLSGSKAEGIPLIPTLPQNDSEPEARATKIEKERQAAKGGAQ